VTTVELFTLHSRAHIRVQFFLGVEIGLRLGLGLVLGLYLVSPLINYGDFNLVMFLCRQPGVYN